MEREPFPVEVIQTDIHDGGVTADDNREK